MMIKEEGTWDFQEEKDIVDFLLIDEECDSVTDSFEEEGNTNRWNWKDDGLDCDVLEEDAICFL